MPNKGEIGTEKIVRLNSIEDLEEEAALWIAKLDSGKLSTEDQLALQKWRRNNPHAEEALQRMATIWGAVEILEEYHRIDPLELEEMPVGSFARLSKWFRPTTGLIAASIFGLCVLGAVTLYDFGAAGIRHYETAVGGNQEIRLADDSVIVLNTNSAVEVAFSKNAREIRLLRGEAHFDVTSDQRRPFMVYAGLGKVQAVGTSFSVHVRQDQVEVTVSEGVVEVYSRENLLATPAEKAPGSAPVYESLAALAVNERVVFEENIESKERLDAASLERELLWRDGLLAFAGEPLSEVIEEMSRYTELRIEITDPEIANMPIGGAFEAGNVESMVEALEAVFGVKADRLTPTHWRLVSAT